MSSYSEQDWCVNMVGGGSGGIGEGGNIANEFTGV